MTEWNDGLKDVLANCSADAPCGDCADCEQDQIDHAIGCEPEINCECEAANAPYYREDECRICGCLDVMTPGEDLCRGCVDVDPEPVWPKELTCSDCGEEVHETHYLGYKTNVCDPCYRVRKGLMPREENAEWIEDAETLSHL